MAVSSLRSTSNSRTSSERRLSSNSSSSSKQEGRFYREGKFIPPPGYGTGQPLPSQLSGSVPVGGGVKKEGVIIPSSPQEQRRIERETAFAKSTAIGQFGVRQQRPSSMARRGIPFRQVSDRTESLIYKKPEYLIKASERFTRKASSIKGVIINSRPFLRETEQGLRSVGRGSVISIKKDEKEARLEKARLSLRERFKKVYPTPQRFLETSYSKGQPITQVKSIAYSPLFLKKFFDNFPFVSKEGKHWVNRPDYQDFIKEYRETNNLPEKKIAKTEKFPLFSSPYYSDIQRISRISETKNQLQRISRISETKNQQIINYIKKSGDSALNFFASPVRGAIKLTQAGVFEIIQSGLPFINFRSTEYLDGKPTPAPKKSYLRDTFKDPDVQNMLSWGGIIYLTGGFGFVPKIVSTITSTALTYINYNEVSKAYRDPETGEYFKPERVGVVLAMNYKVLFKPIKRIVETKLYIDFNVPLELQPVVKSILKGSKVQERIGKPLKDYSAKNISEGFKSVEKMIPYEKVAAQKAISKTNSVVFGSLAARILSKGKSKVPGDIDVATKDIRKFFEAFVKEIPTKYRQNYSLKRQKIVNRQGNSIMDVKPLERLIPDKKLLGRGTLPVTGEGVKLLLTKKVKIGEEKVTVLSPSIKKTLITALGVPTQKIINIAGIKLVGFGEQTTRKGLGTLQVLIEKNIKRAKDVPGFYESLSLQKGFLQQKKNFLNKVFVNYKIKTISNTLDLLRSIFFVKMLKKVNPKSAELFETYLREKGIKIIDKSKGERFFNSVGKGFVRGNVIGDFFVEKNKQTKNFLGEKFKLIPFKETKTRSLGVNKFSSKVLSESILPKNKVFGSFIPFSKMSSSSLPVSRIPTSKVPVSKIPKNKGFGSFIPLSRLLTSKIPTSKMIVSKLPISKIPPSKITVSKIPQIRIPISRIPASGIFTNRTPNSRVSIIRLTPSKIPTSKISTIRIPKTTTTKKQKTLFQKTIKKKKRIKEFNSVAIDKFWYLSDLYSRYYGVVATKKEKKQLLKPNRLFTGVEIRPLLSA